VDATFWELLKNLPPPVKLISAFAIGGLILEWILIMLEQDKWTGLVGKITFFLGWGVLVSLYMTIFRGLGDVFVLK
jgi:hypothetical protein